MQIKRVWSSIPDHPITDPFPPTGKLFYLAFFTGDFAHPIGEGNWFEKPYFRKAIRFVARVPLPHWAWDLGFARGYASLAKPWGMEQVDSDEAIRAVGRVPALEPFRSWLPAEDVYHGSTAIMASIRNGLTAIWLALGIAGIVAAAMAGKFAYDFWHIMTTFF